jgi:hypothetical protein
MLFTFEDRETGELRSVIAANESAARLQLGGSWIDVEDTAAWTPAPEVVDAETAELRRHAGHFYAGLLLASAALREYTCAAGVLGTR